MLMYAGRILFQIHFADTNEEGIPDRSELRLTIQYTPTPLFASIFLLERQQMEIMPGLRRNSFVSNCMAKQKLVPFATCSHTHDLGTLVVGYHYDNTTGELTEISRRDPQKSQGFYPIEVDVNVDVGDILMTVCTYNTIDRDTITFMGKTYADEMCDLYIMVYDPEGGVPKANRCSYEQHPHISSLLPEDFNN